MPQVDLAIDETRETEPQPPRFGECPEKAEPFRTEGGIAAKC